MKAVAAVGAEWAVRQAQWPDEFSDAAEKDETDKFKNPQIKWHQAYFESAIANRQPPIVSRARIGGSLGGSAPEGEAC